MASRRPEEIEQQAGIKLLAMLGAVYVLGSRRPRPNPTCDVCRRNMTTRQTPGLADVRAFLRGSIGGPAERLLEWECKAPGGRASAAQLDYQRRCERAGIAHVLGDSRALETWLRANGYLGRRR